MTDFRAVKRGTVTTIDIDLTERRDLDVLITSDRHLDSQHSDNRLAKRHLEELKERDGLLIDLGDLFDAMGGRADRRGSKSDLSEDLKTSNYFGQLIKQATRFFEPYVKNIAILGTGNHETAILKHNEIDLTDTLIDRLNDKGGKIINGGYRGWIKLRFKATATKKRVVCLYYSHGSGGGGPVTRGVINTNRMAVYLPDADVVFSGHIHEAWQVVVPRVRLTQSGEETQDEQLHLCIPSYKQEFVGLDGGFHHEKGRPPKPVGAMWLRFKYCNDSVSYQAERAA